MITKEKVKKEIDKMPDDLVQEAFAADREQHRRWKWAMGSDNGITHLFLDKKESASIAR